MNINVVTLEDGKGYYEIAKIELNGFSYLVLSGKEDSKLLVRKLVQSQENGKLVMLKLDSVEEFNQVIDEFMKKFQR